MHHLFGLSCQDITRLVSESMDHTLPYHQRVKIRIHLIMCKYCARFEKQIKLMRVVCRQHIAPDAGATLSGEARGRILHALRVSATER